MKPGRFIAVVGPSGAGKDSVMDGVCAARPDLHRVQRVITRAAGSGGELFDAVSEQVFATRAAQGAFALHWTAHGLSYGIPTVVHHVLQGGRDALANLSRAMLSAAAEEFNDLIVLHVTAKPETRARRLSRRGRATGHDVNRRLARPDPEMPGSLTTLTIDNSGALEDSVEAALAALYPDRA